jgi:RNA polymerase sigma-70 factor (ECF subfamily)
LKEHDLDGNPERLFDGLRAGDGEACARFVRDEYAGVYRWLYRLTGRPDEAADLTQESFVAFWESLGRERPRVSPRTWLYAIARNQWRKHCRDRQPEQAEAVGEIEAAAPAGWMPAEREEFTAAVTAALARLSPELREAFSLRLWHEFDYGQIGAVLGISPSLARWRCYRARQLVRQRLGAWHEVEEKQP